MQKQVILKVAGVVVPVVVALAGVFFGVDVSPVIRDLCEAALPSGTLVHEVDAGAVR